MSIAHDIYAETNPAFCACVLSFFVASYKSTRGQNAPLAMAYLALPIVLSDDLSDSFVGTNKKTGLNVWVDRSPQTILALADRINSTLKITDDAVKFGCLVRILTLEIDATLSMGNNALKKFKVSELADSEIQRAFRRSDTLGHWFASAGSVRAVLNTLGVSL